jgi:hypothetical protein
LTTIKNLKNKYLCPRYSVVFFFSLILLVILSAGCRTEPVFNINNHPIAAVGGKPMPIGIIEGGIIQAGNRLGWRMSGQGANTVYAYNNQDGKQVVVLISYSGKAYSVKYLKSQNFLYDGQEIHKNYKKLIINLSRAIDLELANIANKAMFEKGEIYIKKYPRKKTDLKK